MAGADAIDRGKPLSVIRLGDGEAGFLPHRPVWEALRAADQAEFFRAWWGRAGDTDEFFRVEAALVEAIEGADIVGIPALDQFGRHIAATSRGFPMSA